VEALGETQVDVRARLRLHGASALVRAQLVARKDTFFLAERTRCSRLKAFDDSRRSGMNLWFDAGRPGTHHCARSQGRVPIEQITQPPAYSVDDLVAVATLEGLAVFYHRHLRAQGTIHARLGQQRAQPVRPVGDGKEPGTLRSADAVLHTERLN